VNLAAVHQLPHRADAHALIHEFCARYSNTGTARGYRFELLALFKHTGCTHPDDLTEVDVLTWCAGDGRLSNNTIRRRATTVRVFMRWCVRAGHGTSDLGEHLLGPDSPLRKFRPTYGKVQAKHPGRWLTHEEAYERLVPACQDGSDVGLRDELVIRLGLLGLRANEIRTLQIGHLLLAGSPPRITFTGKGYKPRTVSPGDHLVSVLHTYLARYTAGVGRQLDPGDPLVCKRIVGRYATGLDWGAGYDQAKDSILRVVRARARQAGLGHLAPHDLRRSAAGILHRAMDDRGAHLFDLLDIQRLLGHADPATTMRSYLDPIDTAVVERAAPFLD
jgi:integrase